MANIESETLQPRISLDGLLGRFEINMQMYAELQARLQGYRDEKAAIDEFLPADLETVAANNDQGVALAALERLVIERKITEIEGELGEGFIADKLLAGSFIGAKVSVLALNPESAPIRNMTSGNAHPHRDGQLTALRLNPAEGGYLQFMGSWRRHYRAYPLYERREGIYRPLFDIRLLEYPSAE